MSMTAVCVEIRWGSHSRFDNQKKKEFRTVFCDRCGEWSKVTKRGINVCEDCKYGPEEVTGEIVLDVGLID